MQKTADQAYCHTRKNYSVTEHYLILTYGELSLCVR